MEFNKCPLTQRAFWGYSTNIQALVLVIWANKNLGWTDR